MGIHFNSDDVKLTDEVIRIAEDFFDNGFNPSFIISKKTGIILFENIKAEALFDNHIGELFEDVFRKADGSVAAYPIRTEIKSTSVVSFHEDYCDADVLWLFADVKLSGNTDAVLATVLREGAGIDCNNGLNELKVLSAVTTEMDSLTGIPTFKKFFADAELAIQANPDSNFAIVVFDIDKFKFVNDMLGMAEGDKIIAYFAECLKDVLDEKAYYCRMHSDVFAFCFEYEKKGEIIRTIESIRKKISTNDYDFDISTSFGIYPVEDKNVPINLMCDRAVMAKKTIKDDVNKFCAFYDEHYRDEMIKASEIEKSMRAALKNEDFKMYLQPKYNIETLDLCGAEVLCRWIHPEKGLIPPNDFIPVFERNGFILELDAYMWELACKTIRGWIDEGRNPVPLSVNISRYHIGRNNLVEIFGNLIKKYDLQPEMLNLEITESLFLDNPQELNRIIADLREIGFKLEVDDFGSGFSSLNFIRNISVDTIKIDKDFLDSEISTEKGKIVMNHTIDMAKDLNLNVIAEGVETLEHLSYLKSSNCDIAQGFYFARPMPLWEFNKFKF